MSCETAGDQRKVVDPNTSYEFVPVRRGCEATGIHVTSRDKWRGVLIVSTQSEYSPEAGIPSAVRSSRSHENPEHTSCMCTMSK